MLALRVGVMFLQKQKNINYFMGLIVAFGLASCGFERAQLSATQLGLPGLGADAGATDAGAYDRLQSDQGGLADQSVVDHVGDDASAADAGAGADRGPGVDTYVPSGASLTQRLQVAELDLAEPVRSGVNNWRIWGTASLGVAPVYTVPLDNGETLVGFTVNGPAARVARLDAADRLVTVYNLMEGRELRGLAAEADGHFAALLWDDPGDAIFVHRYEANGVELWSEELTNADNKPDDFGIGDSRMAYGDGRYGAYYHVHSDSGHEGDTLKWIDARTGAETTGWDWGCSHSMSNLLRFHPETSSFLFVCVIDCYLGIFF